jgi:hypothetical protein
LGKVAYQNLQDKRIHNNFDNVGYGKYGNVSLGITFLITTHFKLCEKNYRGGLKYEKTGLVVDGESINDGFTLGIGLPITGLSHVNIGFELGKRGTIVELGSGELCQY